MLAFPSQADLDSYRTGADATIYQVPALQQCLSGGVHSAPCHPFASGIFLSLAGGPGH